jgi:hypothetical protein
MQTVLGGHTEAYTAGKAAMTVTGSRGSLDGEDERVAGYARDLEKNPFVLPSDEEVSVYTKQHKSQSEHAYL